MECFKEQNGGIRSMQSITININNDILLDKVTRFIEQLKDDGVEITSKEDMDDLKLLKATRNESSIPFDEYMKNAN